MKNFIIRLIQKMMHIFGFSITYSMRYIGRKRAIVFDNFDYVRTSSLELIAEEIYDKKLTGNVAELGVFRGDYSKKINEVFSDKKLYLFDTFNGFDDKDTVIEKSKGFSEGSQDFTNTSIQLVLNKMKFSDNCIVKKGYFPETAKGLEDIFCFVSIDADLYKPIFEGLNYFFPRLVKGGYIFVHDYNNKEYSGAKSAVIDFCQAQGISYFPLCDVCGSVVIMK